MKTKSTATASAGSSDPIGEFSFGSATPFADKSEYVEKDLIFAVKVIEFQAGAGFEGADRWAVTVEPEDSRGAELLTFGCNEKRDEQMNAAQQHLDRGGTLSRVRLKLSGKAFYLENAPPAKAS